MNSAFFLKEDTQKGGWVGKAEGKVVHLGILGSHTPHLA